MQIELWHNGMGCSEFPSLGPVTLTDEHPASSYGHPVLVDEKGQLYGPGDVPLGYLHAATEENRAGYTAEQLAWLDDLIVSQAVHPYPLRWSFGATLKTHDQLRRIEAALGHPLALA